MDESPTSHVLRNDSVGVDSSPLLPLTDDPPPPPFDYPPKAIESNAALENQFEKDSFVDEILGNPKSESDATKLRERGACLDANLIVEWPAVCDDHHHVEQNNADQLPFPALPPDCNSCELHRQIIHSSERVAKRLEIHWRINSSYHVIICTAYLDAGGVFLTHHDIVELQNFEMAEHLLANYCRLQEEGGHELAYDSNDVNKNKDIRSLPSTSTAPFQPFPERSEGHANPLMNLLQPSSSSRPPDDLQIGLPRLAESRVMVQGERTADQIGLKDLRKYMNVPIGEAAKRLGVCPSSVKKACRRNGLPRWPYREIRAINESIAIAVQRLEEVNDPREKDELLREIADLRNDKELACQGNRHGDDHSEEENDDY